MKLIVPISMLCGFFLGVLAGTLAVHPKQQQIPVVIHKHYTYPLRPDQCECSTDSQCEGIEEVECE